MDDLGKYTSIPATRRSVNKLLTQNRLLLLATASAAFVAYVDNSTGDATPDNGFEDIVVQRGTFAHVTGSDLAQKTSFDTVYGAHNNGIAVIGGLLNQLTGMLDYAITGGDGTVATPGTIPAAAKVVTGADGATATAVPRVGANSAFINLRNNFATLVLAANRVADALGRPRFQGNVGLGTASPTLVLVNKVSTGTAVDADGDTMSKVHADAQFLKSSNNLAYLGAYVDGLLDYVVANVPDVVDPT